jgi:hypothetical protein
MPTQFGLNQTVFHFLDRRQQSLVTQPLLGCPSMEPLIFEYLHPATLMIFQSIALSAIDYRPLFQGLEL